MIRIDDWIEAEFNEIRQTIAAEKAITVPGWRVMFTVPQWRTRLMHGVAVQVFTQLSGISKSHSFDVSIRNSLEASQMLSDTTNSSCMNLWA